MRVASQQGIAPAQVTDALLEDVERSFRQAHPGSDAERFRRSVAHLWNEAVRSTPGWPSRKLTIPAAPGAAPHYALSAFPASFTTELEQYLQSLTDPFSEARTVCCARTIKLRREQLRLAASTVAERTGDPTRVASLADLIAPANAEFVLRTYLQRAPSHKPTSFIHSLLRALISVARDWVRVPAAELEVLTKLQSKLRKHGPIPDGLTAKNRGVLQRLEDPEVRLRLLELPQVLAKEAHRPGLCPAWRLHKMRTAVAVELLLQTAMRMRNLTGLRLGRHIAWPKDPTGMLAINMPEAETKNGVALEFELRKSSAALLYEYLHHFHPNAAQRSSHPLLFVNLDGSPVTEQALARGIRDAIRRLVAIDMTPHQFRHFVAALALEANPDAYPLVKDLLGHKRLQTTLGIYAGPRRRAAGRFWNSVLEREMRQLKTPGGSGNGSAP
jgi:integrase